MKPLVWMLSLGVLAACGADGEPVKPSMNTTVGVGGSGAYGATTVAATSGNTSVSVGLGL
jgi:hypothetical protein